MSDNGKKEVRVWCDGWYVFFIVSLLWIIVSLLWCLAIHFFLCSLSLCIRSWWYRNCVEMVHGYGWRCRWVGGNFTLEINRSFYRFFAVWVQWNMNHDDEIRKQKQKHFGWISLITAVPDVSFDSFYLFFTPNFILPKFKNFIMKYLVWIWERNFTLKWMLFSLAHSPSFFKKLTKIWYAVD